MKSISFFPVSVSPAVVAFPCAAFARTVKGTPKSETLKGSISQDIFYGYGGDDTFRYGLGDDEYFGGNGW